MQKPSQQQQQRSSSSSALILSGGDCGRRRQLFVVALVPLLLHLQLFQHQIGEVNGMFDAITEIVTRLFKWIIGDPTTYSGLMAKVEEVCICLHAFTSIYTKFAENNSSGARLSYVDPLKQAHIHYDNDVLPKKQKEMKAKEKHPFITEVDLKKRFDKLLEEAGLGSEIVDGSLSLKQASSTLGSKGAALITMRKSLYEAANHLHNEYGKALLHEAEASTGGGTKTIGGLTDDIEVDSVEWKRLIAAFKHLKKELPNFKKLDEYDQKVRGAGNKSNDENNEKFTEKNTE